MGSIERAQVVFQALCGAVMPAGHDPALVLLSVAVAMLCAMSSLTVLPRAIESSGAERRMWLILASVVFGGGVWSAHFIGMQAYDPGVPYAFDVLGTLVSLGVAVFSTAVAYAMLGTIQPMSGWTIAAAGLFLGAGIAEMHWFGMVAFEVPGRIDYDWTLVAASVCIALTVAMAAVAAACMNFGWRGRVVAGTLLGWAVVSMHYTGMRAIHVVPGLSYDRVPQGLTGSEMAYALAGATAFVMALALAAATTRPTPTAEA